MRILSKYQPLQRPISPRWLYLLALLMPFHISLAAPQEGTVNISVARSLADTGVIQQLVSKFHLQQPAINMQMQAVGSLQALELIRQQKADLVITHYPQQEKRLVEQGYARKRTQLIQSKFALFGPADDQYQLNLQTSIVNALKIIAEQRVAFVSPSARGGTHAKIEELWTLAGIHPDWLDYEAMQVSSLGAMLHAAEYGSYTIADLGTYLSNKNKFPSSFIPLYQHDIALQNIYSVLVVKTRSKAAEVFYQYLVSPQGQNDIKDIAQQIYQDSIIVPIAHLDPDYIAEHKTAELQQQNTYLLTGILLLTVIMGLLGFVLYQSKRVQMLTKKEIEAEKHYRVFVETSPDWIWEVDANAVYTYASPKVEQLLGYKPEEIIGKTPFDLMPEDEARRLEKIFSGIASEQRAFSGLENLNLHKNGEQVMLETSGVPVFNEQGLFSGYRGVDRDITERKNAEKERQRLQREFQQSSKMESLGHLTGGIAHDFNNLLGVILGFSDLAKMQAENDSKMTKYIDQIQQAGERAKNLVLQMLTFSRNEKVEAEPCSLKDIVNQDVDMLQAMLTSSVKLELDIKEDIPAVLINRTQLEQILINLAVNARDAMNGTGTLGISLEFQTNINTECHLSHKPLTGDWVVLSVSDTGSGMTPDILNKVFDPFFTTKEKSKGTGMGLSVIYGIMVDYGGAIIVDSELGKGTTFHMLFPPYVEDENQQALAANG